MPETRPGGTGWLGCYSFGFDGGGLFDGLAQLGCAVQIRALGQRSAAGFEQQRSCPLRRCQGGDTAFEFPGFRFHAGLFLAAALFFGFALLAFQ